MANIIYSTPVIKTCIQEAGELFSENGILSQSAYTRYYAECRERNKSVPHYLTIMKRHTNRSSTTDSKWADVLEFFVGDEYSAPPTPKRRAQFTPEIMLEFGVEFLEWCQEEHLPPSKEEFNWWRSCLQGKTEHYAKMPSFETMKYRYGTWSAFINEAQQALEDLQLSDAAEEASIAE